MKSLNLIEGNKFEVKLENDKIVLEQVEIYSLKYIEKLVQEVKILREYLKFEYNTFNNVDESLES